MFNEPCENANFCNKWSWWIISKKRIKSNRWNIRLFYHRFWFKLRVKPLEQNTTCSNSIKSYYWIKYYIILYPPYHVSTNPKERIENLALQLTISISPYKCGYILNPNAISNLHINSLNDTKCLDYQRKHTRLHPQKTINPKENARILNMFSKHRWMQNLEYSIHNWDNKNKGLEIPLHSPYNQTQKCSINLNIIL